MPAILVIDHNRASLAVARAYSRLGYDVIMGVDGYCDYANLSRFSRETVAMPDLVDQQDAVIPRLAKLCAERPDLAGVVSVDETATRLLAERREDVPEQLTVFGARPGNILSAFNKDASSALAESLGIPVAPRIVVDNLDDLHAAGREIGAPLAVRAVECNHDLWGEKVLICHTREEFHERTLSWPREGHRQLMVQRFNPGYRHNVCWNAIDGRIHSAIEMKVLLSTTGTRSGYGTLVETVEPHPQLKRYADRLADALTYHGSGSPQFLVDPDSGEISFLEINPRLDANIKLAQTVMPYIEDGARIVTGEITDTRLEPWAYARGRRLFWMKGENQTLRTLRRQKRWRQLAGRAAMMPLNSLTPCHALFSWDDPLPALASHLNPLVQKLPRHVLPQALRWSLEPENA